MSRRDRERLDDIMAALDAITGHLQRGELTDGLVFDAVRIRLLEIGEAVKALPPSLTAREPDTDWPAIARLRDHLAHRYWDPPRAPLRTPFTTTSRLSVERWPGCEPPRRDRRPPAAA